jgi:hypothetical protein
LPKKKSLTKNRYRFCPEKSLAKKQKLYPKEKKLAKKGYKFFQ